MNHFLRINIIEITFQLANIECQTSSLGTTHISPVAQIVHNAYASISCSYRAWLLLLEDAQGNNSDNLREFDIKSKNLLDSYRMFNKSAARTSYNRQQIYKFHSSTSNQMFCFNKCTQNVKSYSETNVFFISSSIDIYFSKKKYEQKSFDVV